VSPRKRMMENSVSTIPKSHRMSECNVARKIEGLGPGCTSVTLIGVFTSSLIIELVKAFTACFVAV
jgi:hypothetical protein